MMPVRRSNQTWLPSIFNDFFDNDWMVKANATAPAINVIESDKDYKVEVAAPGMTKEDFKIHINEDNDLVISMEKKTESTEGDKEGKKESRYLRREFSYSKFQQTLILPDDVDKDKITKRYYKSLSNISVLIDICDILHVYDNTIEPVRIIRKHKDDISVFPNEFWSADELLELIS